MCVDAEVARGAGQLVGLLERDVKSWTLVNEFLAESEIDYKNHVCLLPQAAKEVLGLDITEDEIVLVHELDTFELKMNIL